MAHQSKGVQDLFLPGVYQLMGEIGTELPDATQRKVMDAVADAYERGGIEAARGSFDSSARRIRSDVAVQRIAR